MTLTDAWRGERIPVNTSSGTACRLCVDLRGLGNRPFDRLRLMLVSDVLSRAIDDLHGGQVQLGVMSEVEDLSPTTVSTDDFWIRGPMTFAGPPTDATVLGGPIDIAVAPVVMGLKGTPVAAPAARCTVRVGPVVVRDLAADIPAVLERWEPLPVRLALLRWAYAHPAYLTAARLRRAEATLERWRFKVAQWADIPSAPMLQETVDELRTAIDDDLDIARALRSLHRVEIDTVTPSGAKFETFAFIDRVLGLDLCRLVGKLRGGRAPARG